MIRVCTLFSGYDSQCLALRRLGIDFELVAWSDIDPYAIKAHDALFPEYADRNLGDVAKVDWNSVPDFDLLTYSSPCQDFSLAGLQRGGEQGSGTRSSLLWEVEKAISTKKPKYCVMENVSALVSQKFIKLFNRWQLTLERYGYKNYAKVLNAKDYGVPQNRERIFCISILEGQYTFPEPIKLTRRLKDLLETNVPDKFYLKDDRVKGLIFSNEKEKESGNGYKFEPKTDNDLLANSVTTKNGGRKTDNFILSVENTDKDGNAYCLMSHYVKEGWKDILSPRMQKVTYVKESSMVIVGSLQAHAAKADVSSALAACPTIGTTDLSLPKLITCGNLDDNGMFNCAKRVFNPEGISPTVCAVANNAITKIIEPTILGWSRDKEGKIVNHHPVAVANTVTAKKGKDTQNFVVESPTVKIRQATKEGSIECKVGGVFDASYPNSKLRRGRVQDGGETVPTLMASNSQQVCHIETDFRVRKLTPRECFRLMGLADTEIDTLFKSGLSNTRLYVLAGNSIVVDVLVAIFDKLLIHNTQHNTLF